MTTAIETPPVFSFFSFEDEKTKYRYSDGLFHFLITVSLRGKGCMDRRALPWIIFLYSLFCFWIWKREKETWLPYSYFPLWNRRMKNERAVYTTRGYFPFILFTSCKRKNENGYNGSYFYFSFLVWGLEKKKRMLSYPFSIFYFEIKKRKTKGRYIHGPV